MRGAEQRERKMAKVRGGKSEPHRVLDILLTERKGLTALQIAEKMNSENLDSSKVTVSFLKTKGLLRADGKTECPHCYHSALCYRISEQGRIWLNHKRLGER